MAKPISTPGIRTTLFGHGVAPARLYGRSAPALSAATSEGSLRASYGCLSVIILLAVSVSCSLFLGAIINTNDTYASTINLTIDNATITASSGNPSSSGTFYESPVSTITASTDHITGYTLKILGTSSNYQYLVNTADSNAKLTSITSATSRDTFSGSNNTSYNGKWGYLPSKYNSSANTSFRPAPSTVGDVIDTTSSPNNTANTYTIAIGARIDSSIKYGSYTNTYNIVLIANAIAYSIAYNSSLATNMPADVSDSTTGSSVAISSDIPTRDGYEFKGWCTEIPTGTNGNLDTCSGTTYAAGSSYTLSGSGTNSLTLYAMWSKLTMQNATASSLAAAMPNVGDTTTLEDSRDHQTYTIAKLKDGKYWMVENLNLAGGTALSADDTDVTSTYISGFTTQGGLTKSGDTIVLPSSSASGFSSDSYAYVYNSNNNTTSCGSSQPCNSYYSWLAATLGGKQSNGSTAQTNDGYNAAASICPKGWRLPTSTTSDAYARSNNNWKTGDWYALATAYGANLESSYYEDAATFYDNAGPGTTTPKFLLAGFYAATLLYSGGSGGYYWSATSASDIIAYNLYFNSSGIYSADYRNNKNGSSVRCVFKGQ